MSIATFVILLCALACPLSMFAMMFFMRKGHRPSKRDRDPESREVVDKHTD